MNSANPKEECHDRDDPSDDLRPSRKRMASDARSQRADETFAGAKEVMVGASIAPIGTFFETARDEPLSAIAGVSVLMARRGGIISPLVGEKAISTS